MNVSVATIELKPSCEAPVPFLTQESDEFDTRSVIDCVEWYQGRVHEELKTTENGLMLNTYPATFVSEVRRKIGSTAFFSCYCEGISLSGAFKKLGEIDVTTLRDQINPYGSMLLFGPGSRRYLPVFDRYAKQEHPTLQGWTVNEDGTVQIKNCAVSASTSAKTAVGAGRQAFLWGYDLGDDRSAVDLDEWVQTFYPEYGPTWAIALYSDDLQDVGIILKEIMPSKLIKLGNYSLLHGDGHFAPQQQEVDWLIF